MISASAPEIESFLVGVLDPQDKSPAHFFREKIIVEGGTGAADVQVSGGRGGEADGEGRMHQNSMSFRYRMVLSTRPIPRRTDHRELPPELMNGSGSPATGSKLRFIPMLNAA